MATQQRYEVRESGKSFAIYDNEQQCETWWSPHRALLEAKVAKLNAALKPLVLKTLPTDRRGRDELNRVLRDGGFSWHKVECAGADERELDDMRRDGMPVAMQEAFARGGARWELRDAAGNVVSEESALRECVKSDARARKFFE